MVSMSVGPHSPFLCAEGPENGMVGGPGLRGHGCENPEGRDGPLAIRLEGGGLRAPLPLVDAGRRLETLGPVQGRIEGDPFQQGPPPGRGPVAVGVHDRRVSIRHMADHFSRGHGAPLPVKVGLQRLQSGAEPGKDRWIRDGRHGLGMPLPVFLLQDPQVGGKPRRDRAGSGGVTLLFFKVAPSHFPRYT